MEARNSYSTRKRGTLIREGRQHGTSVLKKIKRYEYRRMTFEVPRLLQVEDVSLGWSEFDYSGLRGCEGGNIFLISD